MSPEDSLYQVIATVAMIPGYPNMSGTPYRITPGYPLDTVSQLTPKLSQIILVQDTLG
jgi:hypothetical protein